RLRRAAQGAVDRRAQGVGGRPVQLLQPVPLQPQQRAGPARAVDVHADPPAVEDRHRGARRAPAVHQRSQRRNGQRRPGHDVGVVPVQRVGPVRRGAGQRRVPAAHPAFQQGADRAGQRPHAEPAGAGRRRSRAAVHPERQGRRQAAAGRVAGLGAPAAGRYGAVRTGYAGTGTGLGYGRFRSADLVLRRTGQRPEVSRRGANAGGPGTAATGRVQDPIGLASPAIPADTMNDSTSGASKGARKAGQRAVTVTDIAQAVGVSRATVSLVLRGSPLVNVDTRAKVEAELRRQRYVYNRTAANLRRRTSSSIALVINDLSNPFFAEFAAGVDEALGDRGYVTLLGSTGESPKRQQAVLTT